MLGTRLTDDEETSSNRNMDLHKDAANTSRRMDKDNDNGNKK